MYQTIKGTDILEKDTDVHNNNFGHITAVAVQILQYTNGCLEKYQVISETQ